jgi:hypothetical protein
MPSRTELQLARSTAEAPDAPEHKRFRSLLERIETARLRLQAWHEALPRFAQAHATQVQPLLDNLEASRRAWAFELEQLCLGGRWSAVEREALDTMILTICRSLLDAADTPDAELKALHDRVAPVSWDAQAAQAVERLKARIAEETGLDLSDSRATTLDELIEDARRLKARRAAAQQEPPAAGAPEPPRRRQKRSKAASKAAAEAEQASQSAREVYRKLAALLHPDRAPADATDAQRQQRHEQMAEANAAYARGDLLALLTLQLRCEQIDLAQAAQLTDARIRPFNKVLAGQLADIEAEIQEREFTFCQAYGYHGERRPDPAKLPALLKDLVREIQAAEATLAHDRRVLRGDPASARRLLKELAREQRRQAVLDGLL